MKTQVIASVGQYGVLSDPPSQELPPNAWTSGQNVRVNDGSITNAPGHIEVFDPPSVLPYWCFPVQTETGYLWAYAGASKIYGTDGSTHSNITRQQTTSISSASVANPTVITTSSAHNLTDGDTVVIANETTATPALDGSYTATVTGANTFTIPVNVTSAGSDGDVTGDVDYSMDTQHLWNGGVLSGVLIANNGADVPQAWVSPALSNIIQDLSDVSDWDSTHTCKVIRPYKNYLIALDITKSATRYPYKVKWNHPSDPGTVNGSWDITDPAKDAGENDLIKGGGFVVDGLSLRDSFVIYRETSTWVMNYIGGTFVFDFEELFPNTGILAPNCAVEYKGLHYVLTQGDVIAHDGHTPQSIIDQKNRRFLFNNIDSTNYKKSFLTLNQRKEEVWICYPSAGSTYVDKALVYRINDGSWTPRDLPDVTHIEPGIVNETGSLVWSSDSENWNVDDSAWNQSFYNPSEVALLMTSADTKLYKGNSTNTENGTVRTCSIERKGLQLGTYQGVTHVSAIIPKIEATSGTQVTVQVGGQMTVNDSVDWSPEYTFTVGVDNIVHCRVSGRLISVKFKTTADVAWRLQSYEIKYVEGGRY